MEGVLQLEMNGEEILVFIRGALKDETIRHALELDDTVDLILSFTRNNNKVYCCETSYIHLPDDWEKLKFVVETRKKTEEPVEKSRTKEDESIIKDIIWFQSLQKYALYYEDSSNIKHCVTPISKNLVATHAYKGCFESNEETLIEIRSSVDPNYQVPAKIVGLDENVGLVVLQSIDTDFEENDIPIAMTKAGLYESKYLMLGLPNEKNSSLTPIVGHVIGFEGQGDEWRVYGSSEFSKEYLGTAVWNRSGQLMGMQTRKNFKPNYTMEQTNFITIEIIQKRADEWLNSPLPVLNRAHRCSSFYCWCGPKQALPSFNHPSNDYGYIFEPTYTRTVPPLSGSIPPPSCSHCSPSAHSRSPIFDPNSPCNVWSTHSMARSEAVYEPNSPSYMGPGVERYTPTSLSCNDPTEMDSE